MKYILAIILFAVSARAATYTAASCNQSDVQAAINSEQATPADGDIISIPAGSCTWSGTTQVTATFTTSVILQGAGAISSTSNGASTTGIDQTTIIDNVNHPSGPDQSLLINVQSGKTFRLTGIAMLQNNLSTAANAAIIEISGTSTQIRVDHCHFFMQMGSYQIRFDGGYGVLDHNFFDGANGWGGNAYHLLSNGDAVWNTADQFGTANFMYVEDSRFNRSGLGDAHDGGRYVVRHCTMVSADSDGPQMFNHGLTDSRGRSVRAAEFYLNTLNETFGPGVNQPTFAFNGGSLLYWGNTVSGYTSAVAIGYTRQDNSTYNFGTTPTDWGNCSSTTGTNWDQKAVPPSGYACLDQPARGSGDLLSGDFPNVINTRTGTIAWPQQLLSPLYVWLNTYTPASGFSTVAVVENDSNVISANRDYYNQFSANANPGSFNGTIGTGSGLLSARPSTCTAGPGGNTPGVGYWATDQNILYVCNPTNTWITYYAPFTYPHPLASGAPLPPTGLTAVAN